MVGGVQLAAERRLDEEVQGLLRVVGAVALNNDRGRENLPGVPVGHGTQTQGRRVSVRLVFSLNTDTSPAVYWNL